MLNVRSIRRLQTVCNLSSRLKPIFQLRQFVLAAVLMLIVSSGWSAANGQQVQSVPVTKCGTVLSAPGSYALSQSLKTLSPTQDCIQISSPGVLFLLGNYNLSGPSSKVGTTVGIHVLSAASGVRIQGGSSTVQNFGKGIVIEASGVSLINLNVAGNVAQGILVNNASNVLIQNVTSAGNGAAGLELAQSTGVIVSSELSALQQNGTYGLWVHSSSNNQFLDVNANQNSRGGIYVGETDDDKDAQPDSYTNAGVAPSQHNVFLGGDTVVNTGDGIRIGAGDTLNVVVGVASQENTGTDAVDGNGNCTSNTWSANIFGTKNPSCLQ